MQEYHHPYVLSVEVGWGAASPGRLLCSPLYCGLRTDAGGFPANNGAAAARPGKALSLSPGPPPPSQSDNPATGAAAHCSVYYLQFAVLNMVMWTSDAPKSGGTRQPAASLLPFNTGANGSI